MEDKMELTEKEKEFLDKLKAEIESLDADCVCIDIFVKELKTLVAIVDRLTG